MGILEKHKDYVLRARDYHSKQERINRLREKAATRNKDEFYFSMTKERTEVRIVNRVWEPALTGRTGRCACARQRKPSTTR